MKERSCQTQTDFSRPNVILPKVITETMDGVNIGRITLHSTPLYTWEPDKTVLKLLNSLNLNRDPSLMNKIRFSLNYNTPNDTIPHERAVSAYYTYNPHDQTLIIEWGRIDPTSEESKLHTYLNRMIDYQDRVHRGMKLSSGHLANLPDGKHCLALFDDITSSSGRLDKSSPLGITVNTLWQHGFIPLASEGCLQFPAF